MRVHTGRLIFTLAAVKELVHTPPIAENLANQAVLSWAAIARTLVTGRDVPSPDWVGE